MKKKSSRKSAKKRKMDIVSTFCNSKKKMQPVKITTCNRVFFCCRMTNGFTTTTDKCDIFFENEHETGDSFLKLHDNGDSFLKLHMKLAAKKKSL